MADKFIGMDVGDNLPVQVTVASSTTSKPIELRVAISATPAVTRLDLVKALEAALAWAQTVQPFPVT